MKIIVQYQVKEGRPFAKIDCFPALFTAPGCEGRIHILEVKAKWWWLLRFKVGRATKRAERFYRHVEYLYATKPDDESYPVDRGQAINDSP